MTNQTSPARVFLTAMAGVLVGALLLAALPVSAATGDPIANGEMNWARRTTILRSSGQVALRVQSNKGAALELRAAEGFPPMLVNSRRLVDNLNSDRVDFRHANELIRAAYGSTADAPDVGTGPIVSTTITAPQPGILIITGSFGVQGFSVLDTYQCFLSIDTVEVPSTRRRGVAEASTLAESCQTNGAQVVDAGVHTVSLEVDHMGPTTTGPATVEVIWVPFGSTGNVPTP